MVELSSESHLKCEEKASVYCCTVYLYGAPSGITILVVFHYFVKYHGTFYLQYHSIKLALSNCLCTTIAVCLHNFLHVFLTQVHHHQLSLVYPFQDSLPDNLVPPPWAPHHQHPRCSVAPLHLPAPEVNNFPPVPSLKCTVAPLVVSIPLFRVVLDQPCPPLVDILE